MNNITKKFIEDLAPEILPFLEFRDDEVIENRNPLTKFTIEYLSKMLDDGIETEKISKNIKEFLQKKAMYAVHNIPEDAPNYNHSYNLAYQAALFYAASHALYSSDNLGFPLASLFKDENKIIGLKTGNNPKNIIMIGGKSEEIFYEIRQYLVNNCNLDSYLNWILNNQNIGSSIKQKAQRIMGNDKLKLWIMDRLKQQKRVQIISETGAVPPYQPPASDINIFTIENKEEFYKKLAKLEKKLPEAAFDLKQLVKTIKDMGISDVFSYLKGVFKYVPIPEVT